MKLDDSQLRLLRKLHGSDQAWRNAKQESNVRARQIAQQEVDGYLRLRDSEVRLAVEAGIPKRQVGVEGLSTSSSNAVEESLARTAGLARVQKEIAEAVRVSQSQDEAAA